MSNYLIRRLFNTVFVVFGVVTLVFFVLRILPGDPAYVLAGPTATQAEVDQDPAGRRQHHARGLGGNHRLELQVVHEPRLDQLRLRQGRRHPHDRLVGKEYRSFGDGVHVTGAVSRRVADSAEAGSVMTRLRSDPPRALAGFSVAATDLLHGPGPTTDALEFTGQRDGTSVRVVVRPSGTEPKLKCYLEVARPPSDDVAAARAEATRLCAAVADEVRGW